MPAQKVLWLPDFLRKNEPARVALGVLVSPQKAQKGFSPENYLETWKDKVDRLLQEREKALPGSVRLDLQVLGPPDLDLHDLDAESLLSALGNHHNLKDGLGKLLRYLRNPNQEHQDDLLEVYPQESQAPSPQEELQEQKALNLQEFLLSL